jgi:heme-degrading monooxygenase HmoA
MLYVNISIHRPHPDKERFLIDSMHRYGEAAKKQHGLVSVHTLKDEKTGELVGLAIWDSKESFLAARPALMKATENDDFDAWEKEPIRGHRLTPV